MKTPLLYKVYRALRRGWKSITPEARQVVKTFVASQKTAHGYMNAGGHEDEYYKQFGEVLEAVFAPGKLLYKKMNLTVQESRLKDTTYGRFFDFLAGNPQLSTVNYQLSMLTTNAVCCILAMQHQMNEPLEAKFVKWLQLRQDESGGFHASDQAPIPDMLSTAVALFTLRLIGEEVKDSTPFIQAHWLDSGGFAPTLYDNYSDVEYVFYGLLALGSK